MGTEKQKVRSSPELEIGMGNIQIKAKQTLSVIVALISVVVAIITFYMGFSSTQIKHAIESQTSKHLEELVYRVEKTSLDQLQAIEDKISKFENDFKELSQLPEDAKVAAEISKVRVLLDDLSGRLKKLEDAILEDPAKALEIPLLEKEVENIKETMISDMVDVRAEVTRIYDLNKWFIGLMFSMAIGIIGLAITNFIKLPKGTESQQDGI